jgi:PAS domain-containing protein/anti-sigma regulatory factor (Ser/Thr protein kinase)
MPRNSPAYQALMFVRNGALLFFPIFALSIPLHAEEGYPVDLNRLPVYVRAGFSPERIPSPDEEPDRSYLQIPPSWNRPVIIPDLKLPGMPVRNFPELRTLPPSDFTLLWRFRLTDEDLARMQNPVLLFAQLGEGWQIYVNGRLLQSHLGSHPLNRRLLRVAVNPRFLVSGTNQIAVHLRGDPLSRETGLYYGYPYRMEEAVDAEAHVDQTLYIVLITIYCSIGLFHILLITGDPKRRFNLYFGLFALILAVYLFTRSTLSYQITDNATLIFRIEMASLALGLPAFTGFLISLNPFRNRSFRLVGVLAILHGFTISTLSIILPVNTLYDLLLVWQLTSPPLLIATAVFLVSFFLRDLRRLIRLSGPLAGSFQALVARIPGNLLLGTLVVMLTSVYDIYAAIAFHTSPRLSAYGLLFFLTGSAVRIAIDLLQLLRANQRLNRSMRQNLINLKRLHHTLSRSEGKYRRLIEETNDVILTLDAKGVVTAANSSLYRELGISPSELIGQPFTSLLEVETPQEGSLRQGFTVDRIQDFYSCGDTLNILVPLFAKQKQSHVFFDIKFEKIRSEDETEIIVKASRVEEEPALKYLVRETVSFEMNNDLFAIEDMVRRLIMDLPRFLDEYEISMIRIGLREIIVNAIEHGNLGITYAEKSHLLKSGNYQEEIRNRLMKESIAQRRVRIKLTLTPEQVRYRISDDGAGFDHRKFTRAVDPEHDHASLHGRGIMITRNAFSKVLYNDSGNSVLLIRNFAERA